MTEPIRWGILGAAKFAREHMGPAIHSAENAVLAAVGSRSPEKAEAFSALAPGLRVHGDYDALLADPEIDAVYVPLPNHLHVEWTKKALKAGKHVLCEKPVAMQANEIDDLIAARDASGLLAAEGFMIVHHPQWQRARTLLTEGAIGELLHVDVAFSFNNPDLDNIRNKPGTGGGALRDIGVYAFGAVRYATGAEPTDLTARIGWDNGIDSFALVTADFPGFTYNAYVGMRMAPRQHVTFHGTDGVLTVPVPFNANVFGEAQVVTQRGMETHAERFPGVNHYRLQVENFGRAIRGEIQYPCPLEFSRGTQAMMDRVYAAAG